MNILDINQMPQSGAASPIVIGTPISFNLPNGLQLLVIENHAFPLVEMKLIIDRPPYMPEKAGLTALAGRLFGSATKFRSAEQLSQEIEHLGASMYLNTSGAGAVSLSKHFHKVFALWAEAVLFPHFSIDDFKKEKNKYLQQLRANDNSTEAVADKVADYLIYSAYHPYGVFPTEETIESITMTDVQHTVARLFTPERGYMLIMGDITPDEAFSLVKEQLSQWSSALPHLSLPTLYVPENAPHTQVNFIDMPQAVQASVGVYHLTDFQLSHDDYFASVLMNYLLGGSFTSYINMNLREKHGYTYGASSNIATDRYTKALFGVQAKVRTEATADSVQQILYEVARIQQQLVSDTELRRAKEQYLGNFIMGTEQDATLARLALNIRLHKLPADFYHTFSQRVQSVSADAIRRSAQKHIDMNRLRIVIVGNKEIIAPQLSCLQFGERSIPTYHYSKEGVQIFQ